MTSEDSSATGTVTDRLPGGTYTSLLILGGVILLLVPEPITSFVGLLVLVVGIGLWLSGRVLS